MTRAAMILGAAVLAVLSLAVPAIVPAEAQVPQVPRLFVSGGGNDGNACTFTAPCRTLQQAFNVAPANAEIDVLDPAGYGPLTISHGISIQGHGFAAITQATGGAAAIVVAAQPSDVVLLNGLLLDGESTGLDGNRIQGGASVQIVNCVIRHFSQNGINNQAGGAAVLSISNTITSDSASTGILLARSGALATLDAVTATNNATGVEVDLGQAIVTNSNLSNNGFNGLNVNGGNVMVKTSVLSNNGNGSGLAGNQGTAWLARTAIYGNGTGVSVGSATVNSFNDNDIGGNGTNVSGSLTTVSTQ
jgi:hypothetical protein